MKAIITVVGIDKIGIIAEVTTLLSSLMINIEDISQTVIQDYFTMMMLVDTLKSNTPMESLQEILDQKGNEIGMKINISSKEIFDSMHRI